MADSYFNVPWIWKQKRLSIFALFYCYFINGNVIYLVQHTAQHPMSSRVMDLKKTPGVKKTQIFKIIQTSNIKKNILVLPVTASPSAKASISNKLKSSQISLSTHFFKINFKLYVSTPNPALICNFA